MKTPSFQLLRKLLLTATVAMCIGSIATAQVTPTAPALPYFSSKNGLGFTTPDSSFGVTLRFRIQSRFGYTSVSETDLSPEAFDIRVRRTRLRLDGFVFNPRLTYNLQLSFSRADMDWDNSQVPNVLRDAMINYKTRNGFTFSLGQGKLPGNRQRVISSGALQFADRSIVNAALTLDRDVGVFASYNNHIGDFHYIIKSAVTAGEGRNPNESDKGLAYTGRIEVLPLGKFTEDGDYFEGDLVREKRPKVSLAATAQWNESARRTQGQLGKSLYTPRDIYSFQADGLLKYNGFALSSEYLYRSADTALTYLASDSASIRYVYTGWGINTQASYCFKSMWEIALRHSYLEPEKSIRPFEEAKTQLAAGVTKYLVRHRVKLQADVTYEMDEDMITNKNVLNFYQVRFQVELGI